MSNKTKDVAKFKAITFSDKEFTITLDDECLYCEELFDYPIDRIFLNPNMRFINFSVNKRFSFDSYSRETGSKRYLIREYQIDDDLLYYMINNGMARISTDMALFYGFDLEYGYDRDMLK